MATYKEQQANKKSYVLTKNGEVLATFGNLRKVISFVEREGINFYKYSTLVRKEMPVIFGEYELFKVRHY